MNDDEVIKSTIVRECHNAWKDYMESLGNAYIQIEPTDEMRASILSGARFYVDGYCNGRKPTPQEQHEEWVKYKTREGWTYGFKKNHRDKTHPCLRPYDALPLEERRKDEVFAMAVENAIRHLMVNRHYSMRMIQRALEVKDGP